MTAGWGVRTVRAAVFAAVCVLLAALGHVLMSGSHVPGWTLGAGAVATGAAGWCLAGRERGLPAVVGVAVVAQTALHHVFSLGAARAHEAHGMHAAHTGVGHPPVEGATGLAGSEGSAGFDGSVALEGSGGPALAAGGDGSSSGMLAAHLLAALLTGLWLGHGERAAFRILRAVAGRLTAPLRLPFRLPPALGRPRVRPRRPRSERRPALRLLVHALTSRGPPRGTAVA
ncbi:hypothetical protein [Streptomyces werraensis]|uniref:hypothetical protein n=1 Tax=Streptomyces werraensis TaxID=68284 RepID=UPI0033B47CCF